MLVSPPSPRPRPGCFMSRSGSRWTRVSAKFGESFSVARTSLSRWQGTTAVGAFGIEAGSTSRTYGRSRPRSPSWLMSSTTPSATKNSASFDNDHVENGRS